MEDEESWSVDKSLKQLAHTDINPNELRRTLPSQNYIDLMNRYLNTHSLDPVPGMDIPNDAPLTDRILWGFTQKDNTGKISTDISFTVGDVLDVFSEGSILVSVKIPKGTRGIFYTEYGLLLLPNDTIFIEDEIQDMEWYAYGEIRIIKTIVAHIPVNLNKSNILSYMSMETSKPKLDYESMRMKGLHPEWFLYYWDDSRGVRPHERIWGRLLANAIANGNLNLISRIIEKHRDDIDSSYKRRIMSFTRKLPSNNDDTLLLLNRLLS